MSTGRGRQSVAGGISIEVVYATPERQALLQVDLPDTCSVAEAIAASKITEAFPGHDLAKCAVGIWGKPCDRTRVVADGDRIEIYRELPLDPRDARRRLAELGSVMGQSSGGDSGELD